MTMEQTLGLRICVTEADPKVLHFLETALEYLGHQVELCNSGEHLLRTAGPGAFDLLLLDLQLQPQDGLELLKVIQEREIQTPAILMSSRHPTGFWSTRLRYANVTLLLKPFSLEVLERAIRDHKSYPGRTFR